MTGAASLGQGVETVLAQICADAMGMDYSKIRVVHGTTNRIRKGFGSHASRTTVMTGGADAQRSARTSRRGFSTPWKDAMTFPVEVLEIRDGIVVRTDIGGEPVVTLAELAREQQVRRRG